MITETIGFLNSKLMNFEAVMKIKNVFSERGTSSKFSIFRAVFNDRTLSRQNFRTAPHFIMHPHMGLYYSVYHQQDMHA